MELAALGTFLISVCGAAASVGYIKYSVDNLSIKTTDQDEKIEDVIEHCEETDKELRTEIKVSIKEGVKEAKDYAYQRDYSMQNKIKDVALTADAAFTRAGDNKEGIIALQKDVQYLIEKQDQSIKSQEKLYELIKDRLK